MFSFIIEQAEQLFYLQEYTEEPTYVEVISSNDLYHPKLSDVVAVYLHPIGKSSGFIICINHSEALSIDKEQVCELLSKFTTLYTTNKKNLLYSFNLPQVQDISLLYTMTFYKTLDDTGESTIYNQFYSKFTNIKHINKIIPLIELYDIFYKKFLKVKPYITLPKPDGFDFFNLIATDVFYKIESNGIKLDINKFTNTYGHVNKSYSIKNNIIYTQYNLYNMTSRPSNRFNNINFAAIPKKNEYREVFIPQNDTFITFDYDSYHLRLICNLLEYEIKESSVHRHLARLYYNTDEIDIVKYKQSKQINFHAIYGTVPSQYKNLPFFKKLVDFQNSLWDNFNCNGKINTPISQKPFTTQLKKVSKSKLLNYFIQALETSQNIIILKQLQDLLQNKQSKIVLYTYDAITLDYSEKDGDNLMEEIKKIISQNGKFPFKIKSGAILY